MEIEPTRARFDLAAEPTLQRIRRDRESSPRRIQPLLAYLEGHVYDLDLDYQQLKKACGVRDNTIPALFHQAAGLPPATYIRDCRMETAARLLVESDVKVWQISQLVGYSSLQVFGRAFKRWSKLSPVSYRRRHQKGAGKPRRSGIAARRSSEISEALRRALQGQAPASEIGVVMQQLVELYPHAVRAVLAAPTSPKNGGGAAAQSRPLIALDRVQRIQAEAIWSRLVDLAPERQREVLRRDLHLRNPNFFHFLREKSRELGRDDRERGVAVAELALESLNALEPEPSPEDRAGLEALAWATVGNARRLALDFDGAETAFERAHRHLEVGGSAIVEGEVLAREAAFRWSQRRISDALRLQDAAVSHLRGAGDPLELASALVMRGVILNSSGRPEDAIPSFKEALDLLDERPPGYLETSAVSNLLYAYLNAGRAAEALGLKRRVERAGAGEGRHARLLLTWLQGLASLADGEFEPAERALSDAHAGLLEIGAADHVAGVSLALAELHLVQGDRTTAARLAGEALPMLASLGAHPEAAVALETLETALATEALTESVVHRVRGTVERLQGAPAVELRRHAG